MKALKRSKFLLPVILVLFLFAGCQTKSESEKFDAFIQQEFVDFMESDYVAAHIYMENPKDFGVDASKITPNLGARISQQMMDDGRKATTEKLEKLKAFDRLKLTEDQQDTYDIYMYMLSVNDQINDEKFDYYQQLFESMTGIHYQLPVIFSDWTLRNEQDVKDLIAIVNDVKPYIASIIDYTKEQEKRGLLMVDIDEVISYCQKVLDKGEESSVLTAMNESIDALGLDAAAATSYKDQLKDAFVNSFIPAYSDIIEAMNTFKSGTNNEEGYAKFQYGKEYYELRLQQNSGSQKSVEEIREMMQNAFKKHLLNLQQVLTEHPDLMETFGVDDPGSGYSSYTDILDSINSVMFENYPEVSNLSYNIRDINEEISSDSGVAAYFNIPPMDGSGTQQMRVNPNLGDISSISTYYTVAHEGYPGHMYQYAYMYQNLDSPFRKAVADSSAYTEGWAVYAQYSSLEYLTDLDPAYIELFKENELATYCYTVLADIGIHYDGMTYEEFVEFMTPLTGGLDDENMVGFYKQLQANPSAFESYYVGYEEFAALKAEAEEALGNQFNLKAFNETLLKSGNASFDVVAKNVDKYIEEIKNKK